VNEVNEVKSGFRRFAGGILGLVMLANVGCYAYEPIVGSQPAAGERVALELTDQGRTQVAEQVGPGVLRIEGMLQQVTGEQYVLSVSRVTSIGKGTANWGGERVRIPVNGVARSELRTLSKSRTALVVGAAAVGVVALILSRTINGGGFQPATDTLRGMPAGK
jgi:hypothetical protein